MRGTEHFQFNGPSTELEVERLVQDVFSRAFSAAARAAYDGITPYEAYLCRIARNLMITEGRRAATTPQPTLSGELPDLETLEDSPEELVQRRELQTLVEEFLGTRPEDEQKVYDARFRQGETQEHAAVRLGTARITVRRVEARLKSAFVRFLIRRNVDIPRISAQQGEPHEP